jgi:hypothetical protein
VAKKQISIKAIKPLLTNTMLVRAKNNNNKGDQAFREPLVYGSRRESRPLSLTTAKVVLEITTKAIKPSGNHWYMVQERIKAVRPYRFESGPRNNKVK